MKHFFADPNLGLIGLLFFFIFFCVVTLWTYRPGAKKNYADHGHIPLNDDDNKGSIGEQSHER